MKALSTAVILALATTAVADNFVETCDVSSVKFSSTVITATCKNILGQTQCSSLDLNPCLKIDSGSLQPDPMGAG